MNIILKTPRLILRPLSVADLSAVHRYAADPENARYMYFGQHQTEAETAAFLSGVQAEWQKDSPAFYEFALTKGGAVIGAVSVYPDGKGEGELGWILDRSCQRQGFAYEAAQAVIGFAFHQLGLHALIAHCDTRNRPSWHLMEKLGMERQSSGPRLYPKTGETAEEFTYRLTRPLNG